jgi:hypothetical protein
MWNKFCVFYIQFRKKTKNGTYKILHTKATAIKKMDIIRLVWRHWLRKALTVFLHWDLILGVNTFNPLPDGPRSNPA